MKKIIIYGLAGLMFSCAAVKKEQTLEPKEGDLAVKPMKFDVAPLLAQEKSIVEHFPKASNKLAFDLYQKLNGEQNPVFSPLSISAAMAMAYVGTQKETEEAFKKVLYFGDNNLGFHKSYGNFALLLSHKDRGPSTTFEIANNLWLKKDYAVKEPFKNTLVDAYNAEATSLDFSGDPELATKTINQTIAEQTHGEIDPLLKSTLPADIRLVLTNALYFKSKWQDQFKPARTHEDSFTKSDGSTVPVKFMVQERAFAYGQDGQSQWLLMPYEDNDFATLFVLPAQGKLSEVEKGTDEASFQKMLKSLSDKRVNVKLPKFSQKATPKIKNILEELGLGIAFDQHKANFEGISAEGERLYIADVVHEAVVKMYEEGTTAAAATAVLIMPTSMPPQNPEEPINFHADHPFLYYIIHQPSGTILFMGRVDEPKE